MRRTDMLKAREILRLKKAGLSLRNIAKSTGCGKRLFQKYCHVKKKCLIPHRPKR